MPSLRRLPPLRWTLFFALIAISLIAAPAIVLRAAGYRFDFPRLRLVETGAISVHALPPGAEVRVEATRDLNIPPITKRTSALSSNLFFPNLLPGEYRIVVDRAGRAAWQKTATVEEKKTSSFPFVRLFPNAPSSLTVTLARKPQGLAANPDASAAVGWDHRGIFGANLVKQSTLTALTEILAGAIQDVNFVSNETLLVHFANGALVEVRNILAQTPAIIPLPGTYQSAIPFGEDRIVGLAQNKTLVLIRVTATGIALQAFNREAIAIAGADGWLSFLDPGGILWTMRDDGSDLRQRTVVPLADLERIRLFSGRNGEVLAVIDSNDTAWFLDEGDDRFSVLADGIADAVFSHDNAKLLLVGSHEISLYAVRERLDQPIRPKGSREIVTRFSEPIKAAAFLPQEEEYAAVLSSSALHIVELDGRGNRNDVSYPPAPAFALAHDAQRLLVLDADSQELTSISIPSPDILERIRSR
ncbi:MAG: hypothetical protein HY475_01750 [Candidatus Terrybacteria bacterium]|nr:hypothetical protein [Candidatus Terrybacteria bacterium]